MRTFDEKEIGQILRRASSLSTSEESETGLGLTTEELHAIGRASGIDPDDIDRAIEELQGSTGKHRTSWWGGPTRYERTIVVDGEMDAESWERIVTELRSTFHSPGTVSTRGSTYEWTSTSGGTSTHHVSVNTANGRSRIRLFWNNEHNGIPAFVPVLVGSLIVLPIIFDSGQLGLAGIPVWLTIFGLLFMGCRFFLDRYVRQKEKQIDTVAAAMERVISAKEAERTGMVQVDDARARTVESSHRAGPTLDPIDSGLDHGTTTDTPASSNRGRQRS